MNRSSFRAWLVSRGEGSAGYPGRCDQCPLASFLRASGAPAPYVRWRSFTRDWPAPYQIALPGWARVFVREVAICAGVAGRREPMSAARCLRILDTLPETLR